MGLAVLYPNAYEGYWDVCSIVGNDSANGRDIDDMGFLTGMVDKLITEIGVDPGHGIPQPYRRGPRLLGPSPKEPNGPEVIWAFFERQRP